MKILFITATYLPTINGVSYHIKCLKKTLEKKGHRVFVLAPSFPNYKDNEKDILRYPSLPNPFANKYPLGVPIYPLSKIKSLKVDVVHTHHPLIIGKFAAFVADRLHRPLYFTAHTHYEQYLNYYFPHGYDLTSKFIVRDLVSLSSKCQRVICPSPQTEKRLLKYGIRNTKMIFHGINTQMFPPKRDFSNKKLTLVYTGRIEKEKNSLFLIKIANELKKITNNFRLVIIGDGNLLPKLSDKVIKNKLEDHVQITGFVSQEILPDIYRSADIFITASTSEVMPLSILEAQSSGLPVIALKKANLESVVKHDKSGLLLDPQPRLIAEEIIRLSSNSKKMKVFSREARATALKNSIEVCAEKLLDTYKSTFPFQPSPPGNQ